jgi:hypothetical protein
MRSQRSPTGRGGICPSTSASGAACPRNGAAARMSVSFRVSRPCCQPRYPSTHNEEVRRPAAVERAAPRVSDLELPVVASPNVHHPLFGLGKRDGGAGPRARVGRRAYGGADDLDLRLEFRVPRSHRGCLRLELGDARRHGLGRIRRGKRGGEGIAPLCRAW